MHREIQLLDLGEQGGCDGYVAEWHVKGFEPWQIDAPTQGDCLRRSRSRPGEALIKSLSDFILGFLCNARNNSTQIASY
ncbi:hypothetical protein, partial [uncultured Dialister sp.]|uniref:hypothetical protein n=2 Tax=uncultured Dialister sp. TaxID=278064 RepID=UPI00265E9125